MSDIAELESRIAAAMGRIGQAVEAFTPAAAISPEELEEARERLATAIDAMPTEQMREILARSAFAARLAGASGLDLGDPAPSTPN